MRLPHLRSPAEIAQLIDEDDAVPSKKRAAVTIIDLRTRLEVRTLALTISIAINTAFITHWLLR